MMKAPLFDHPLASFRAMVAESYIIPSEWFALTEKLKLQGIKVKYVADTITLALQSYWFSNANLQHRPFEHRRSVTFDCTSTENHGCCLPVRQ